MPPRFLFRFSAETLAPAFILLLLSMPVTAYQESKVSNGASIEGRVSYGGAVPMRKIIPSNPEVCGQPHDIPLIEIDDNKGVTDAVVYLQDVAKGKAWPKQGKPAELDNIECRFRPQLLAMAPGSIVIVNSDTILHNTHAFYGRRTALNIALPKKGHRVEARLDRPGIVRVECDEHGHMSARIFVGANPYYAATASAGKYSIDSIPPGEYKLVVYQEETGPIETSVKLKAGEQLKLDIDLAEKTFNTR